MTHVHDPQWIEILKIGAAALAYTAYGCFVLWSASRLVVRLKDVFQFLGSLVIRAMTGTLDKAKHARSISTASPKPPHGDSFMATNAIGISSDEAAQAFHEFFARMDDDKNDLVDEHGHRVDTAAHGDSHNAHGDTHTDTIEPVPQKGIVLREDPCPCCQGSGTLVIWLPTADWELEYAFRVLELEQHLETWESVRQCKSCLLPFAGHKDVEGNDTCTHACHKAWLERGRRPLLIAPPPTPDRHTIPWPDEQAEKMIEEVNKIVSQS